ncbi:MAG: ATP-binding protein [Smithella sp.]
MIEDLLETINIVLQRKIISKITARFHSSRRYRAYRRDFKQIMSGDNKILVLYGQNGVGKSTLIQQYRRITKRERGYLSSFIDFRNPRGSLSEVVQNILEELDYFDPPPEISMIMTRLRDTLDPESKKNLDSQLVKELEECIFKKIGKKNQRFILFFDSFEHQPNNEYILEQFNDQLKWFKIMAAIATEKEPYGLISVSIKINGVDRNTVIQAMEDYLAGDSTSTILEPILSIAATQDNKYHPLIVGLSICLAGRAELQETEKIFRKLRLRDIPERIRMLLVEFLRVVEKSDDGKRDCIMALSVPHSFNEEISSELGISSECYGDILTFPFVIREAAVSTQASYHFHETVRSILNKKLKSGDNKKWVELNKKLVSYYSQRVKSSQKVKGFEYEDVRNKLIYHMIQSDEDKGLHEFINSFYKYFIVERNMSASTKLVALITPLDVDLRMQTKLWLRRTRYQLQSELGEVAPETLENELKNLIKQVKEIPGSDIELLSSLYDDLARHYVQRSCPKEAIECYELSLQLKEQLLDGCKKEEKEHYARKLARALAVYGSMSSIELKKSNELLQRAKKLLDGLCTMDEETINSFVQIATRYARVMCLQCKFKEGLDLIEECFEKCNTSNYNLPASMRRGLEEIRGRILSGMGKWDQACKTIRGTLDHESHDEFKYFSLIDLADTERMMGDFENACLHYKEALGIADKFERTKDRGFCYHGLGLIMYLENETNLNDGAKMVEEAVKSFNADGNSRKVAEAQADLALMRRDRQVFLDEIESSLGHAKKAGARYSEARALLAKSKGFLLLSEYENASSVLVQFEELLKSDPELDKLIIIKAQDAFIKERIKGPFTECLNLAKRLNEYFYEHIKGEVENGLKRVVW